MEKYRVLMDLISTKKSVIIAFSGGVDSTLVALACSEAIGDKCRAVMFDTEAIPDHEIEDAKKIAREIQIPLDVMKISILNNHEIISNTTDRCGFCKKMLMSDLVTIARSDGFQVVADGSIGEDLDDHRPGLRAANELGIWHPLMEAGIGKEEAREILKVKGISIHDKPSTTCFMTRIPYDEPINAEKMELIGKVEEMVRKNGFKDIRLRLYERRTEGYIGVLEVDEPGRALDIWESIRMDIPGLKMVLDPRGYRQGSLNEGMVPK